MTDLEQSAMIEHHDMTTPTTRAGKALLADPASGGIPGRTWQEGWEQTILAVEDEARAEGARAERERIAALVAEIAPVHLEQTANAPQPDDCVYRSDYDAILAATEGGGA